MVQTIMRLPDVEKATGKKRSSIYQSMADGNFPKPIKLGKKAVGWIEEEIKAWQSAQIAERDASTSKAA